MRSLRYTNGLLTVIAVLLALHLWTWVVAGEGVLLSQRAVAQDPAPSGALNPAVQRKEMTDQLKLTNQKMERLIGLFESGRARVKLDEPRQDDARATNRK